MSYHVWTPGDELPDGIPEGCERWGLNLCQWIPEVDSPSDWGHHQPRRWPISGYTEDQLKVILQAAPPPETLKGYRLEYRIPRCGECAWFPNDEPNTGSLWQEAGGYWQTPMLIRIPTIEYIEDDEITDDMLCGRRVPCEVRDSTSDKWVPHTLVLVTNGDLRFVTKNGEPWRDCRIKKSDLPVNQIEPKERNAQHKEITALALLKKIDEYLKAGKSICNSSKAHCDIQDMIELVEGTK